MTNNCYHCGDSVIGKAYLADDHSFCCNGCKTVYILLKDNQLDTFYNLDKNPGVKPSESDYPKYAFLELENLRSKFINYEDDNCAKVNLFLPQIHCSSCIYLLENLSKIEPAVQSCQVNFTKREASISFSPALLKLSELASLLDKIGYAPNFGNRQEAEKQLDKQFLYKLGIAGFGFGSIMLWSFPEYLGIEDMDASFRNFTSYLSLAISLPILLYSANSYFISAFKALRYKSLNLDVPISIGIVALYAQSVYTILNDEGPGYMDSFAGFIFFLLIGKWFQNKTYKTLSFERDYTSYFPVAVSKKKGDSETIVEIEALEVEDEIYVRNEEVIPCDSELIDDEVKIDYSFVTGEAIPVIKKKGDFIYAGGKLLGQRSRFKVMQKSKRSHLTQLWNDVSEDKKSKGRKSNQNIQDRISSYFLVAILFISLGAAIAWYFIDPSKITQIVVSILIVACPCALALASPFTFGNIMRLLGRKGLYLKNTSVVENINEITDIVFDKTGTLTSGTLDSMEFIGRPLSLEEKSIVLALANNSTHPLSRSLVKQFQKEDFSTLPELLEFEEVSGNGIKAIFQNKLIKLGSAHFIGIENNHTLNEETSVHLSIDEEIVGKFIFHTAVREGLKQMLLKLKNYNLHVISGDTDKDKNIFEAIFPAHTNFRFQQSPKDKLHYIESLKKENKKVMMIGDGLNDAGALGIADVGIAVSEDIFRFTPSSDAIIEASQLKSLPKLLQISNFAKLVLRTCLVFSVSYNIIGLSIAISGRMSPLNAAILMPLSSVTVVFLSSFLVVLKGKK